MVRAGKRERREVADRRGRGDGRVERVEQAPELRPRGPERPHLLRVGVERRDQRDRRMPQRRPAQARDERLVEVQQVEVLRPQQHVDVGDELGRRRDELERPALLDRVGRAGEEVARIGLVRQEDGLALAGQHRLHTPVRLLDRRTIGAGSDDRDLVTRRRQPLGERPDLLVDRRRSGPEERREDAQLERHTRHGTAREPPARAEPREPRPPSTTVRARGGRGDAPAAPSADGRGGGLCGPPAGQPWQTAPAP